MAVQEGQRGQGASVNGLFAQTRAIVLVAAGLAFAVYMYELNRMTVVRTTSTSSSLDTVSSFLTIVVLAVMGAGAAWLWPQKRLLRHAVVPAVCAVLMSVTAFILLNNDIELSISEINFDIIKFFYRCFVIILLACWAEEILQFHAREAAMAVSLAFVFLGALSLFTCLFREAVSAIMVALFPVASLVLLLLVRTRSFADGYGLEGTDIAVIDDYLILSDGKGRIPSSFLCYLQPLVLCPIVFGFIHYSWIPSQDGASSSLFIQLSAALGTALGGAALLVLVRLFWGRRKLALYNFITLAVVLLALSLVNGLQLQSTYVFIYIILLNIAQKIVFFFAMMMPFLIVAKRSPFAVWCLAFALYQLGKSASTLANMTVGTPSYYIIAVLCAFLSIVGTVVGIVLDQRSSSYGMGGRDGSHGAMNTDFAGVVTAMAVDADAADASFAPAGEALSATGNSVGAVNSMAGEYERVQVALKDRCSEVARDYQLTRREEDVLLLAARGMVAKEIADELCVSESTAKTHLRNIYAKLGIHSQTDLLLIVKR